MDLLSADVGGNGIARRPECGRETTVNDHRQESYLQPPLILLGTRPDFISQHALQSAKTMRLSPGQRSSRGVVLTSKVGSTVGPCGSCLLSPFNGWNLEI